MSWDNELFFSRLVPEVLHSSSSFFDHYLHTHMLHVSTPEWWLWSVLLGWRGLGRAGEPRSQPGADGRAAAGRQDTTTHLTCSFFSWLCHFHFASGEWEKTDMWAALRRERKEARVGEKSIGRHGQGGGGGEDCETEGRGHPGPGAGQGRAEQRAFIQPSRWGGEGEW